MNFKTSKTSAVIIIGNEILCGRTADTNIKYITEILTRLGIGTREVRVIPDEEEVIVKTVNELRVKYDYIFTTGGIGPTHDDITAVSIAKAFGVKLEQNPEAVRALATHYEAMAIKLNKQNEGTMLTEARLRMAMIPVGAKLINNDQTGAPGFQIGNVYVMAGIPFVMHAMMAEIEKSIVRGDQIFHKSIDLYYPESKVAKEFAELQNKYPEVEMGSYPYNKENIWGTELTLKSTNLEMLDLAYKGLVEIAKATGARFDEKNNG